MPVSPQDLNHRRLRLEISAVLTDTNSYANYLYSPSPGKGRQEEHSSGTSLGYIARLKRKRGGERCPCLMQTRAL